MVHVELAADVRPHEVFFHEGVSELAAAVTCHVRAGLACGEPAIVIATPGHLRAVEAELARSGLDVSLARASGAYIARDAAATLDAFMVDGSPDPDRFTRAIAGILDTVAADGVALRVFGEMVAILWEQGNVLGALALESLWNDLAEQRQFSLLCAYPTAALSSAGLAHVNEVCHLHSVVLPPTSYGSLAASGARRPAPAQEVFVAVPEAVAAARRFIKDNLMSWGERHLVPDGTLIMSELATNAIIHGGSAFRASIERAAYIVRIAVEDVGPGLPRSRRVFQEAPGGRGVAIVEELSHRWGCDRIGGGKVIWVELEAAAGRPL